MKTFIKLAKIVNSFPSEWKVTKRLLLKKALDLHIYEYRKSN